MTSQELEELLVGCYSEDLCYPKVRKEWNNDNKYWGMCAITALVVDDYFNTELGKIAVDGVSHYFNIKDGKIIDLTAKQFGKELDYSNFERVSRDEVLLNQDTKKRYKIIKNRLRDELA